MELNNQTLDKVIKRADEIYDNLKKETIEEYYDICMSVAVSRGYIAYIADFDSRDIDARILELNKDYDFDNCDEEVSAWGRRFDCEV